MFGFAERLKKVKTYEEFKEIIKEFDVVDPFVKDMEKRSRLWEDSDMDLLTTYSWKKPADALMLNICRRWMTELKSGKTTDGFPVITAWLALSVRDPGSVKNNLFSPATKNAQTFDPFEQLEDSARADQYGLTADGRKVRGAQAMTNNWWVQGLDALGERLIYLASFLALMSMRASVRNADTVTSNISTKGVSMYNQIYTGNKIAFDIGTLPRTSLDSLTVGLGNSTTLFNTVLIAAIRTRQEGKKSLVINTMIDSCIATHTSFTGLGLYKHLLEASGKFAKPPEEMLEALSFRGTKESIDRLTAFLQKYMQEGSTSKYFRWARNISSDYFLNLQPRENPNLFVMLAYLVLETGGPVVRGPVKSMAYKTALNAALPNIEDVARGIKKIMLKELKDTKASTSSQNAGGVVGFRPRNKKAVGAGPKTWNLDE